HGVWLVPSPRVMPAQAGIQCPGFDGWVSLGPCFRWGDGNTWLLPPAATQRLVQRDGVTVAAGLRLHQRDDGLLLHLFGLQHGEVVHVAQRELLLRDGEVA